MSNAYVALRASLNDRLGPASLTQLPAILDDLWRLGVCLVPAALPGEYVAWLKSLAQEELLRGEVEGARDPLERIYELMVYELHSSARRAADAGYRERMKVIDAEVAARVAKVMGPSLPRVAEGL